MGQPWPHSPPLCHPLQLQLQPQGLQVMGLWGHCP